MESVLCWKDMFWSQKAKYKWLKKGDGNTKYFHWVANGRKMKNTISSLSIQGQLVSDFCKIKDEAIRFFLVLYKKDGGEKPRIPNLLSSRLEEEVA